MKNDKSITHECNVLTNILNPIKGTISKNSHYSPILQGFINTLSGRANFRNFRILLEIGSSYTLLMVNMTSKLKPKNHQKYLHGKPKQGSSQNY